MTDKLSIRERLVPLDSYERHKLVQLILEPGFSGLALDAGGLSGSFSQFMPAARIVALNVDLRGDVLYDGTAFPFSSCAFDAVVSLDTLEHIARGRRKAFISECLRTARSNVIIAAPYGTPGHAVYEKKLDCLYEQVHGKPHPWLHEHVVNGLPTAEEIVHWRRVISESGYQVTVLYSGDYVEQCQVFERSLRLRALLGPAGRLGNAYLLVASLALWHKIDFHEGPYDRANRFYLVAQRVDPESTFLGDNL